MTFGKAKLELKVGIFVFIGIIILVTFVLLIGNFKTWTASYDVNIIFNFANGVKVGAPVRFAGVDVGEVNSIGFMPVTGGAQKVKIKCIVRNEVKIPLDSAVWVNTLGLLGEKYIEIMPGHNYAEYLKPRQDLAGVDPIPMHEVVDLAKNIADNISEAIEKIKNKEGTMGKLLYDDSIYKELEALIQDIRRHPWKLFWKTKEKKK